VRQLQSTVYMQVKQALPLNNLSKAKAVDSEDVNDAAAGDS
jgi:hypothetical protein